jgi:hypothetical protein
VKLLAYIPFQQPKLQRSLLKLTLLTLFSCLILGSSAHAELTPSIVGTWESDCEPTTLMDGTTSASQKFKIILTQDGHSESEQTVLSDRKCEGASVISSKTSGTYAFDAATSILMASVANATIAFQTSSGVENANKINLCNSQEWTLGKEVDCTSLIKQFPPTHIVFLSDSEMKTTDCSGTPEVCSTSLFHRL